MTTPSGSNGVPLATFARQMIIDPSSRNVTVPVLFWESITKRAPFDATTMPGAGPTRPRPGEPVVYAVERPSITIGRTTESDVVIDDASVSRVHARLTVDVKSGQWSLSDAGSLNGTFARGERLKPDQPFALGDEEPLVLGSVSARFLLPEAFYRYLDAMRGASAS